MSKQALKRVRAAVGLEITRKPLDSYAWPGGYPLFYLCSDGAVLCPDCVNENIDEIDEAIKTQSRCGWRVVAVDVNYECTSLYCEECGGQIESAYGDDNEANDEDE